MFKINLSEWFYSRFYSGLVSFSCGPKGFATQRSPLPPCQLSERSLTNQALMSVYFLFLYIHFSHHFTLFPASRFLFQTITPGQSKGTSQTEWQVMTPSERLPFPRVLHCPNQDVCIITPMSLALSEPLYRSFMALHFLTERYWTSIPLHPCLWWIVIWLIRGWGWGVLGSTGQSKSCLTMSESVLPSTLWCADHRPSNTCGNLQSINPLQLELAQQIL